MSQTDRRSRRLQLKDKRRADRKRARKRNRTGEKAGSLAIHSRLPGLEGTEIGSMGVIVDARRKQLHPAEITVSVSNQRDGSTTVWIIETGFSGQAPRVGYQRMESSEVDAIPETTWICELTGETRDAEALGATQSTVAG